MSPDDALVPLTYDPTELDRSLAGWRRTLLDGYRWMLLARALDRRMLGLQRQGRVGFYGAATGQEVVSVGAALALTPDDWVFPGLREQLIALVRGHPLPTYVHHLFATDLDPARGRQMPCHPTARDVRYVSMSSVIGTQITQGVGLAYALKAKRQPGAVLAFFGDGATSANDFHAGLNLAGVWRTPVLFCCTNNQWAISQPVERQTGVRELAQKAAAYGLPGRRVDGTDLIAVYREVRDALARIRSGAGPEMLEFLLYRMTAHSSSDDPTRYQAADWMARAAARDPVPRVERFLLDTGLLTEEARGRLAEEVDRVGRAAVAEAEAAPPPDPASLFQDVFASASPGSFGR